MKYLAYEPMVRQYLKVYFGDLDESSLADLLKRVEWIELQAGTTLLRQGDTADGMYILLAGRLMAYVQNGSGKQHAVGIIYKGESVGEMALLTESDRTASVRASRDSVLIKIDQAEFERLCMERPLVLRQFSRILVNRLHSTNSQALQRLKPNLTLVPLNAIDRFDELMHRLVGYMQAYDSVELIDAASCQTTLGLADAEFNEASAKAPIGKWLTELDAKDQLTVYQAPGTWSYWAQKCIRQADLLYLVVDADLSLEDNPLLDYLLSRRDRHPDLDYVLILIHEQEKPMPSRTKWWLDRLQPTQHYHIRRHLDKDIHRLARYMTGNAIGVAFGGGGAKGMAHVGVLKAFNELGIEVDMVSGTSIGSIVGASLALDWSQERMLEVARRAFLYGKISSDFSFPIFSLLKGANRKRVLQALFDYQIEDLWLPYLCVSCDISTNELILHERGSLCESMIASSAIPGVFPPSIYKGHFLVDGGLVNNLPGDYLLERGCRHLITVDLGPGERLETEEVAFPSGSTVLRKRLSGKRQSIPSMPGILQVYMRSTFLAAFAHSASVKAKAQLVLDLPVDDIGVLEWKKLDAAIDIGYRHTMNYVAQHGIPF